ncbi:MAG: hypothetical protein NVSMB24_37000 [Mucilaginibacter sp.]
MRPDINKPFFFSINHLTKADRIKLFYGVKYNGLIYYLLKTLGVNDCKQLDYNKKIDDLSFDYMCKVISKIEAEYARNPPAEFINFEIFRCLVRLRNPRFDIRTRCNK